MKIAPLKISLFFVITLSIIIIIAGFLSYKNLIGILSAWNQSNKMNIYLKVDSTEEDKITLVELIKKKPNVATVKLIDRHTAGLDFQKSLKEFSSGLITQDEMLDLIPETIEVDLEASLNILNREAAFSSLAKELATQTQIDEINYSSSWFKKFETVNAVLKSIGIFVFIISLIGISYLISLMVRTYIEDSKQEIEVYSLLGATRWSIYFYFLKDIFLFLMMSFAISFGVLFSIFSYLKSKLNIWGLSSVISDNLHFLSLKESLWVMFLFFLFVYTNSFMTIQSSVTKLNQLSHD